MPDYSKGKIYTIRCKTDDTMIYVGSSIQPLYKRLCEHKSRGIYDNRLIYKTINNNWDNWYIELYELYPCSCKEELNKREGEIIREIGTLNCEIAGRTQREYYEDNKEYILNYHKIYHTNNKEKILAYGKEYYKYNKERQVEYRIEYRNKNKEVQAEYHKEWRENNKDKIKDRDKEYYENHKEHVQQIKKEYYENNKDKISKQMKEKITCKCGCIVNKNNLIRHRNSQKHLDLINKVQIQNADDMLCMPLLAKDETTKSNDLKPLPS